MKILFVALLCVAWQAIAVGAETIVNTDNPVCFICGALNTIATTLSDIDFPEELEIPIVSVACDVLELLGLRGLIPTDICYAVQTSEVLRDLCGCIELPAEEDGITESFSVLPTTAPLSDDDSACNICGSNTATITERDAIVDIPKEFNSPIPSASCATLAMIGLGGLIPAEACLAAQSSIELKTICGCEEAATSATAAASDYPSDLVSDTPSSSPSVILSAALPSQASRDIFTAASVESSATKMQLTGSMIAAMLFTLLY